MEIADVRSELTYSLGPRHLPASLFISMCKAVFKYKLTRRDAEDNGTADQWVYSRLVFGMPKTKGVTARSISSCFH